MSSCVALSAYDMSIGEDGEAHPKGIEYYRCTLCAVKGKRLVEVVTGGEKALVVGAVCYVDTW